MTKRKRANGEGTIYQRANGTWTGQITTAEGKRITFYGKTQKEVIAKMKATQADITKGTFINPSDITIGQWLRTWLDTYKRHKIRPTTYDNYNTIINTHIIPAVGSTALQKLQSQELQELYNKLLDAGYTRTVVIVHTIMNSALAQAAKNQVILRNVAELVELPKVESIRRTALTGEQLRKFLDAAKSHRLYTAIILDAVTGIRRGELLGLQWGDIDFKKRALFIGRSLVVARGPNGDKLQIRFQDVKTKSGVRQLPLTRPLKKLLEHHKAVQDSEKAAIGDAYQDNDLVFCTTIGTPIHPRSFNRVFENIKKKAGLENVSPHILRHTFATRLMVKGVHPKVVQELMGHATVIEALETYTHTTFGLKKQALKALTDMFPLNK